MALGEARRTARIKALEHAAGWISTEAVESDIVEGVDGER